MTEQPAVPANPEIFETPEPQEPAPEILATPKEPRRLNRRLVVAMSSVLALAVAAGGSVWALDRLGDADRTAPTTIWAEPAAGAKHDGEAAQPKGLAASLLPMPTEYEPGPDIDDYGNDTVLSKKQAVAVFKESSRGLPAAQTPSVF